MECVCGAETVPLIVFVPVLRDVLVWVEVIEDEHVRDPEEERVWLPVRECELVALGLGVGVGGSVGMTDGVGV